MDAEFIAHVRENFDGGFDIPHYLLDHIQGVAVRAEAMSAEFGNGDWGRVAGLWHDLGKYKADFQAYIRAASGYQAEETNEGGSGRVDHSIVGALWAMNRFKDLAPDAGSDLGYLIAGHHAGLPDWAHVIGTGGALKTRLAETGHLEATLRAPPPQDILDTELPSSPPGGVVPSVDTDREFKNQFHLWIRMLFSCLVDADFLDTEAYMNPAESKRRTEAYIDLSEGKRLLDAYLEELGRTSPDSPVNRSRHEILAACRKAAEKSPGVFSLTVPTGGGKTLAGMAFAIDHALKHGQHRVIVVIPYTSIIEQTAEIYRKVFGTESVIEHHSNLDPDRETARSKLASENWNAPIIVTTNVQFFESLFAARGSACRKLHNLANAVIILDEAQLQPVGFLEPIIEALKGLGRLFGSTIVLSTATQPAFAGTITSGQAKLHGFDPSSIREIIPDPATLSRRLKRIELIRHAKGDDPVAWEELAQEIAGYKQVLCIVNTRRDCRDLHALLPAGAIHLSALMCPEHRSEILARIKSDLKASRPLRVVSTQLVEAGVDIDFPVVYRALAGLDSIAQAAGRCNREGRLAVEGALGKVIVFTPPKPAPAGMLRKSQDAGCEMFRLYPAEVKELAPSAFASYFRSFYTRTNSFDEKGIMDLLAGPGIDEAKIQFRSAAQKFSLIEDGGQRAIIVDYQGNKDKNEQLTSEALAAKVEAFGPDRDTMRRLQRYSVNVPKRVFETLLATGSIRELKGMEGLYIQALPGLYDETFGLRLDGPVLSPEDFIA